LPKDEREHAAYVKECHRQSRKLFRQSGPNGRRAVSRSARSVAGGRSTLGGRLARMLGGRIGLMKNRKSFADACSADRFPVRQFQQLGGLRLQHVRPLADDSSCEKPFPVAKGGAG
jgi:hypothetical protein